MADIEHNDHTLKASLDGYAAGQHAGAELPCLCWWCVEAYIDCLRDGIVEAIELREAKKQSKKPDPISRDWDTKHEDEAWKDL